MRTVNPDSATHCSAKSISCVRQFALSFALLIFSMNVFQSGNQICTDAKEIKFTITSYRLITFKLYFFSDIKFTLKHCNRITRQVDVSVKRIYLVHTLLHNSCCLVESGYSPEGPNSWGSSSPVAVLPVFTWSKVIHLSPVVGLLI